MVVWRRQQPSHFEAPLVPSVCRLKPTGWRPACHQCRVRRARWWPAPARAQTALHVVADQGVAALLCQHRRCTSGWLERACPQAPACSAKALKAGFCSARSSACTGTAAPRWLDQGQDRPATPTNSLSCGNWCCAVAVAVWCDCGSQSAAVKTRAFSAEPMPHLFWPIRGVHGGNR